MWPLRFSGVRSLTSRLLATRRAWWGHPNTQYVIFFPESPHLLEQSLYLSLILALASFHTFAPVEVALSTHGWRSTSGECGHFYFVPTDGANVDTLSTENGFLLWDGSESSRSDVGIWTSCLPAHKCPDKLSRHTLRSLSQIGNP